MEISKYNSPTLRENLILNLCCVATAIAIDEFTLLHFSIKIKDGYTIQVN